MYTIPMREFQQKGKAALPDTIKEPVLLVSRTSKYFLIPTQGDDIDIQYREYLRAMALANLRAWHIRAKDLGVSEMSLEEINKEIQASRQSRREKKKSK